MHADGRGVGIHYHPSLPRILHLTSVLFICRMGPRGLPWQGFATAGMCKNLCSSGLFVVSFRYLHTNHFYHKDVAFPAHFRHIKTCEVFEAQQPSGTSPRNPMKETTSFWCPPAAMVIWKKNTTTFARHPCVARFFAFTLREFFKNKSFKCSSEKKWQKTNWLFSIYVGFLFPRPVTNTARMITFSGIPHCILAGGGRSIGLTSGPGRQRVGFTPLKTHNFLRKWCSRQSC